MASSRILLVCKIPRLRNIQWRRSGLYRPVRCMSGSNPRGKRFTLESLGLKIEPEKMKGKTETEVLDSMIELAENKMKAQSKKSGKPDPPKKKPLPIVAPPFALKSFQELGVPPALIEKLQNEGFDTPTDVQSTAIPVISENRDVVIQSYTGSGKTLAYVVPILAQIGPFKIDSKPVKRSGVDAVVVAPSRELGMQIVRETEKLLGHENRKQVQQLVGGANRSRQEEALKKNKPVIVVGTPGRMAEIMEAGRLKTNNCRYLVLDEVDELLSFNFRQELHHILEFVGRKSTDNVRQRQLIMVSATVPLAVVRAATSWGRDPLLVQAKTVTPMASFTPMTFPTSTPIESLPPLLRHYYCISRPDRKVDTLRRCIYALDSRTVIVFMNYATELKDAMFKLLARGISATQLHGDLPKLARSTTLQKFKSGEIRVLVTNELSARGLDVAECDLVVNLGLPADATHYAHRAGRAARLGRRGNVVTICEKKEEFVVKKIEKHLGFSIPMCDFMEGELVYEKVPTEVDGPVANSG